MDQTSTWISSDSNETQSSPWNITARFYYGNSTCMDISSQLTSCADFLSPKDLYHIETSIAELEADAIITYQTLAQMWPSSCDDSLWAYACLSVFQPHLCENITDNTITDPDSLPDSLQFTNTIFCQNDCMETLKIQCLNGSEPNLCQKSTCTAVSSLISECAFGTINQNNTTPEVLSPEQYGPAKVDEPTMQSNDTNNYVPEESSPEPGFINVADDVKNSSNVVMISWIIGLLMIIVNWLQ